jgi:hypothetical protein
LDPNSKIQRSGTKDGLIGGIGNEINDTSG